MGSIGGAEETAHVLAIPDVQHGHIVPMLRLVKQFLRKGITVTFINFQAQISALALTDASSELRDLESEENFRIIGLRNVRKAAALTQTQFKAAGRVELGEAFEQQLMEKMVRDKTSGVAGGPTCILSDMFLPWTQGVAQKLQIPRYMLVPSGVIFARYMQGFADLYEVGELRTSEIDGKLVKFDGQIFIPGLPPLRYHEMTRPTEDDYAFFMLCCKSLWDSAGVLINSFFELEEKVIESWTTPGHPDIEHTKVPKIYPIGPLFVAATADANTPAALGSEEPADKNLLWLSSQPTSSVLYIAFGSQVQLSPEQIRELALGLEDSKQLFLWVIPKPKFVPDEKAPSIADVLPPGFQARIGDRGCIVNGWAPQRQILTHSSTGAFLTHCGWNSSLETVMLGVPLIAWPQASEQFLNCRYLVDVLKIAEEVQAGAENIVERSEIERAVRLLMVESEGKAMRRKAEELQRTAEVAVAPGGSRSRAVEEFVHDILSRYHA